ncbi:hypothetical protein [Fodinibius sediminis]|uniref:Secreted protein n=1 Tax=Fodinibius sediminis TaxID=1214077 RepID=A0A521EMD9_9BACT|nr:hypothetical protein [Fodinibius sediminis]SMO84611.1 hypothetical protein SAMN06265218_11724 [Fodinibius sediminis]
MTFNKPAFSVLHCIAFFMISSLTATVYGQHSMHKNNSPLTRAGNDIFGTIQEVVQKLEADPNTDWSQVDLEALRQHLLDMKAFTEEVQVLSKDEIDKGTEIMVRPGSERAARALQNVLRRHPAMIKKEQGWTMKAERNKDRWIISCTTSNEAEVEKIRALGYIGLLAKGSHHPLHHWMIATGQIKMK